MKTFLVLGLLLALTSCISNSPQPMAEREPSSENVGEPEDTSGGSDNESYQSLTSQVVRVKNYNQYNMTLEKLTGMDRSKYNTLFESLKGSLPADNLIEGLTPFNLVAMTRLADAYCTDFIDAHAATSLSSDLVPLQVSDVRDFLFHSFLDVAEGDDKYASLKTEVENVLKNDDGSGAELFPNAVNNLEGNKDLAVAACVTILASPYITLLE